MILADQAGPIISELDDDESTQASPSGDAGTPATNKRISAKIERMYRLVPAIGTRWRWYDVPYRFLSWCLSSWRRRLLPWRLRLLLNRGRNFFISFEHFARTKVEPVDDPMHNLVLPPDEEVRQGGVWVVELFTPSHYGSLERSLHRNGWDSEYRVGLDGTNAEQVRQARDGRGFSWYRLGTVARPDTKYLLPDAKREVLPDEFDHIDVSAVQLGTSVTAVVAHFTLSEPGCTALNHVWKSDHEPLLEWNGLRRPTVLGRYFAAIKATQLERQRIHDMARSWLAKRCGGLLASTVEGQPVLDFNVFDKFDPTRQQPSRSMSEGLRALGLDRGHLHIYVSDRVPGAVFIPVSSWRSRNEPLRNCWGLIGSHERMIELNEQRGYGEKPYSPATLGAMFDDYVRTFMLYLAAMRYTEYLRAHYSLARDKARIRHRRFSPRRLGRLRDEILTASLDLPTVARDTAVLWDRRWKRHNGVHLVAEPAPDTPSRTQSSYDVIQRIGAGLEESLAELLEEDAAYRTVLATTASLGASADASRMGRLALAVAAISLIVAVVSMLMSEPSTSSLWKMLLS